MTPRSQLAIAELALYSPALLIACYLIYRNGWRQFQYLYLATLASIRIIGSILAIKAASSNDTSFVTTAAILNGVGLSPLVLAMLGFVQELCTIAGKRTLAKQLHWLHLPIMVALPLVIVGVLQLFGTGTASHKSTGRILAAAGLAQFITVFLIQAAVTLFISLKFQASFEKSRMLVVAVNCMVPLILLRLTYAVLSFFVTSTRIFSPNEGSLAVQVVMSVLPENLVAVLGLALGFLGTKQLGSDSGLAQHHHRLASLPTEAAAKQSPEFHHALLSEGRR